MAGPSTFRPDHPRDPPPQPRHHDRDPDTRLPALRSCVLKIVVDARSRTCSTTTSRRSRASIQRCAPVRDISTPAPVAAGQGARSDDFHQVRHHGWPWRGPPGKCMQVMDDMRAADVDFLTIGQIPTAHAQAPRGRPVRARPTNSPPMKRPPIGKGFLMVSATPLTRSSYHAGDDFARLSAARQERLGA